MYNISIQFTNKRKRLIDDMPYVLGNIKINDYIESLRIPLEFWTIKDYETQWKQGLEKIKSEDKSCLVSSALNPKIHKSADIWSMYKIKNKIYIQPYILMFKYLPENLRDKEFTPETCYDFNFRKIQKTGDEWIVDIK